MIAIKTNKSGNSSIREISKNKLSTTYRISYSRKKSKHEVESGWGGRGEEIDDMLF